MESSFFSCHTSYANMSIDKTRPTPAIKNMPPRDLRVIPYKEIPKYPDEKITVIELSLKYLDLDDMTSFM